MTTADSLQGLVGLRNAKRLVVRLLSEDAGVQAVLFSGAAQSGKHAISRSLAKAWLCTSPGPSGACGECPSCHAFERDNHADFLTITPQPPSNVIRLAAVTGRDDGLSIQELFRTAPLMGRNRVVMMLEAERMNGDAANALLKTLEEPPPRGRLILTSSSPSSLPATILSRCLCVACELPTEEELHRLAPEATDEDIELAMGIPGRLVETAGHAHFASRIFALAKSVAEIKPADVLGICDQCRDLADDYEDAMGCGARKAQADVLAELAIALRGIGANADIPPVVEAHRRIIGNANATLTFNALFAGLSVR